MVCFCVFCLLIFNVLIDGWKLCYCLFYMVMCECIEMFFLSLRLRLRDFSRSRRYYCCCNNLDCVVLVCSINMNFLVLYYLLMWFMLWCILCFYFLKTISASRSVVDFGADKTSSSFFYCLLDLCIMLVCCNLWLIY